MDLIFTDASRRDIGVLLHHDLDLAIGKENDFELTLSLQDHLLEAGACIYCEGSEYGGVIDQIAVDTAAESVAYTGRTWHGVLGSKILAPDPGADYLTVSGEANAVLGALIQRMDLGDLFSASTVPSGIMIQAHQMPRYTDGYAGITGMLASVGAKLRLAYTAGTVTVWAEPIEAHADLDSDQVAFKSCRDYSKINHLICLGTGELAARTVLHLYADASGVIATTQSIRGADELVAVFDYPSAQSVEDLRSYGLQRFRELREAGDSLELSLTEDEDGFDVGDIVTASETVTGLTVSVPIAAKIVRMQDGEITIRYTTDNSRITVLPIS